jgi:tetratricopeptide (TPR) repeat protein
VNDLGLGTATMAVLFAEWDHALGDDERAAFAWRVEAGGGGAVVVAVAGSALAVFPASSAAVRVALEFSEGAIGSVPRVGLAAGEVEISVWGVTGHPVDEAAHLCARTRPGRVLATDVMGALVGGHGIATFMADNTAAPAAADRPAGLVVRRIETAPKPEPTTVNALPVDLGAPTFVGRSVERYALGHAWLGARTGDAPVVFVSGPAGIGKTTLMADFARRTLENEGGSVIYARAANAPGEAWTPFAEALRAYVAHLGELAPDRLAARLGPGAGELVRLAPELAEVLPEGTGPTPLAAHAPPEDVEAALGGLHDAILSWLAAASADAPLILIIDDLHRAGAAAADVLRRISRSRSLRVLVLAGVRDDELWSGHPIAAIQDRLVRSGRGFEPIRLQGLAAGDTGKLLALHAGPVAADRSDRVHAVSGGNPLVVRHANALLGDDADGDPEPLRAGAAVDQRLARLDPTTRRILGGAALIGDEFGLPRLASVVAPSDTALRAAVDAGVAAGLLVCSNRGLFRYRFTDPVTADACRHLAPPDLVDALQQRLLEDPPPDTTPAAQAARVMARGDADRVDVEDIDRLVAAGRHAADALDFASAAWWWRVARDRPPVPGTAADAGSPAGLALLVDLGTAEVRAGLDEGRSTLLTAAELARQQGDEGALLGVACALTRAVTGWPLPHDADRVAVLREVTASAVGGPGERAWLQAELAASLVWVDRTEERFRITAEALAAARSLGVPRLLAQVLLLRLPAIACPDSIDERIALSEELYGLAEHLGHPVLRVHAALARAGAARERGDRAGAEEWLARAAVVTPRTALIEWLVTSTRAAAALLAGELELAERLADDALLAGGDAGRTEAEARHRLFVAGVRRLQGRMEEALEGVDVALSSEQHDTFLGARAMVEAGRGEVFAPRFAQIAASGFPLRREPWLPATLVNLAFVAAGLDAVEPAATLAERLRPWSDRFTDVFVPGPVTAHALAMAAATAGDDEQAHRWFDEAVALHQQAGARLLVAETRIDWARLWASRGEAGPAEALAHQALEVARERRASGVEARARAVLDAVPASGAPDAAQATPAAPAAPVVPSAPVPPPAPPAPVVPAEPPVPAGAPATANGSHEPPAAAPPTPAQPPSWAPPTAEPPVAGPPEPRPEPTAPVPSAPAPAPAAVAAPEPPAPPTAAADVPPEHGASDPGGMPSPAGVAAPLVSRLTAADPPAPAGTAPGTPDQPAGGAADTPAPPVPPEPAVGMPVPPVPRVPAAESPVPPVPRVPAAETPVPPVPRLPGGVAPVPPVPRLPGGVAPVPPVPRLPGGVAPVPPVPRAPTAEPAVPPVPRAPTAEPAVPPVPRASGAHLPVPPLPRIPGTAEGDRPAPLSGSRLPERPIPPVPGGGAPGGTPRPSRPPGPKGAPTMGVPTPGPVPPMPAPIEGPTLPVPHRPAGPATTHIPAPPPGGPGAPTVSGWAPPGGTSTPSPPDPAADPPTTPAGGSWAPPERGDDET